MLRLLRNLASKWKMLNVRVDCPSERNNQNIESSRYTQRAMAAFDLIGSALGRK